MVEGTVRWFGGKRPDGKTRGYGFILQDNGEEIFVHYSEIEKDKEGFKNLTEGQRVSFTVGEGQDGKAQAMDVRVIEGAAPAPGSDPVAAAEAVAAAAVPGADFGTPAEEAPVRAAEADAADAGDDDDDDDDQDEDSDDDHDEDEGDDD